MSAQKAHTQVNTETGEIRVVRPSNSKTIAVPDMKTVTPLSQVAGENPPALNLRDNREFFNGKEIIIVDAKFKEGSTPDGKLSSYVLMSGFVFPAGTEPTQEHFCIVMTGSENVQGRLAMAEMNAGEGSPYPLRAKFRCAQGGRAWFLD